jgi:hypothetical protein
MTDPVRASTYPAGLAPEGLLFVAPRFKAAGPVTPLLPGETYAVIDAHPAVDMADDEPPSGRPITIGIQRVPDDPTTPPQRVTPWRCCFGTELPARTL